MTRYRVDFNKSYKTPTNSDGFNSRKDRASISQRANTASKFAFSSKKNSGFVVFTMSPQMHRCCHREIRIIDLLGGNCPRVQEISTFAISHVASNHSNIMSQKRKCCSRLGTGGIPNLGNFTCAWCEINF